MSPSLLRRAALAIARRAARLLGGEQREWARAIEAEVDVIPADSAAFWFAASALFGIGLMKISAAVRDEGRRFLWVGVGAAAIAVLCGAALVHRDQGATAAFAMQLVSLALAMGSGFAVLAVAPKWRAHARLLVGVLGSVLLAVAFWGFGPDDARRWVLVGAIPVQPSAVFLPMLVLVFSVERFSRASVFGLSCALLSLVLQGDWGFAFASAAACAVAAWHRPCARTVLVCAASLGAAAATLARHPIEVGAFTLDSALAAFMALSQDSPWLVATACVAMCCAVLPHIAGRNLPRTATRVHAAFWTVAIACAVASDGTVPLVAYGGSFVVGFFLSVFAAYVYAQPSLPPSGSEGCNGSAVERAHEA
jgi:hypothetical protein